MKKILISLLTIALLSALTIFAQTQTVDKKGEAWVEQILKSLTLREKIGQMVMVRMSGSVSIGATRYSLTPRFISSR